jgi:hypothetical protein
MLGAGAVYGEVISLTDDCVSARAQLFRKRNTVQQRDDL